MTPRLSATPPQPVSVVKAAYQTSARFETQKKPRATAGLKLIWGRTIERDGLA
jgi:hypothetical protein